MPQKPWRPIVVGEVSGRFTRQQIEAAVEAVKARNEGKPKRGAARSKRKPDAESEREG